MSLLNIVTFYKDGIKIRTEFINCGWICNPETIASALKRTISMSSEKFDWDYAEAYGTIITNQNK